MKKTLVAIILLKLILGLLYITQQPLWQYHEADFVRVVRHLRDYGEMPVLDAPDTRNESQPPLYYILLTPFVRILDDNQPAPAGIHPPATCEGYNSNLTTLVTTRADNPPVQGVVLTGYILRTLSLGMALLAVVFTYMTGLVLFPTRPAIALVGAAIIAFEPTLVALASEINNDNLILVLGAVHVWFCARLLRGSGNLFVNGTGLLVLGGLAVLSKLSGWLLLGISCALIVYVIGRLLWRSRSPRQTRVALIGAMLLMVGLAGLVVFNVRQYGSVFGRYRQLDELIGKTVQGMSWPIVSGMTLATVQDTLTDYQAPLNALQPRAALVTIYRIIILVALIAAVWAVIRTWWSKKDPDRWLLLFLWGYALLVFGLVIFRSILNNSGWNFVNTMIIFAPVRYYAPALPALALLFSAGFMALLPARFAPSLNWIGVGAVTCWMLVSTIWLTIPFRANQLKSEAIMSQAQFAALTGIQLIDIPSAVVAEPQLLGYHLQKRPEEGLIDVTLYLQAEQPLATNYMAQINLINEDLSQPCRFMPVRGLYPTPRWQPEQVIVVHAEVPNCKVGLDLPTQLQLRWLPTTSEDRNASITEGGSPIELGAISESLGVAAECPTNLGVIGGGLQILKNNTPTDVQLTGDGIYFVPSVNWLARSVPEQAAIRVYTINQSASDTVFTCAATPRQQTYPFDRWTVGETVYFDECVVFIPAGTPTGTYTIQVGVQDTQGNWLPAKSAGGIPLPDGQIVIGEVTIR